MGEGDAQAVTLSIANIFLFIIHLNYDNPNCNKPSVMYYSSAMLNNCVQKSCKEYALHNTEKSTNYTLEVRKKCTTAQGKY